jgi:hypothetical protein
VETKQQSGDKTSNALLTAFELNDDDDDDDDNICRIVPTLYQINELIVPGQ